MSRNVALSPEPETGEYVPADPEKVTFRIARSTRTTRPQVRIVQTSPASPGRPTRFVLGTSPLIVGRRPGCQVLCETPTVSRMHARIERMLDGRIRVTDLGSANGTYINGVQIVQAYAQIGDVLAIGSTQFLIGEG